MGPSIVRVAVAVRLAVYPSVLYGEDWIKESIDSLLPHVHRVLVVMMQRPWGGASGVEYRGERILWPEQFDRTRERIAELHEPRVEIVEDQTESPWNRWGHAVWDVAVLDLGLKPSEVVLLDPDCVFSKEEAERTFAEWDAHPEWTWAQPRQVELWRTLDFEVRRPRSMVTLCRGDLSLLSDEVRKKTGARPPEVHQLTGTVHNLGFACSERATYWKHLCALSFSAACGESPPNPDWFEEKWRKWTPETRDLEVSIGSEGSIPCALPYEGPPVPESVRRRFSEISLDDKMRDA